MTPEASVKLLCKRIIAHYEAEAEWPVQNGMGRQILDSFVYGNERCFFVECKAPGKSLTRRQWETKKRVEASGTRVIVFDGSPVTIFWLHDALDRLGRGIRR